MLSLKRARTDPTSDGCSQKRIRSQTLDTIPSLCSDQQDICQDAREEVTSDAPSCSDASDHSTTPDTTDVNETERCIHKLATSCALVESVCCACADKRLGTFNYVQYVDGIGDCTGTRWQHYCPGCKDYWRMKEGTEDSLTGPLGMKDGHTRELNMTFKLWVDTVRQTLNIVGSIDLKVDDLKATVAQLLECNLEEVTLESNGTMISSNSDLFDRDHFGGIIARRCLSTIECRRADSVVDDEEDMMEDVQFTGVEPSVWYVVGEGSEQAGSITT